MATEATSADGLNDGPGWKHLWAPVLLVAVLLGAGIVFVLGAGGGVSALTAGLLLAAACVLIGMLLGFLFGIPRSQQPGDNTISTTAPSGETTTATGGTLAVSPGPDGPAVKAMPAPRRSGISANTNLEQISDWLTKILVGVGLTQLNDISARLQQLGAYFGPSIGGAHAEATTVSIVLLFTTCGFLLGFLWTRLYLGSAFANADLATLQETVRQFTITAATETAEATGKALAAAQRYMGDADAPPASAADLKSLIGDASPPARVQLFYKAREARKDAWNKADKAAIARTIPVFEALIAAEKDGAVAFQYHAQLGYALKDKDPPDYARALVELNWAIETRDKQGKTGYRVYNLNRALCRIALDPETAQGQPSRPANAAAILSDLKLGLDSTYWSNFAAIPALADWIARNNAAAELTPPAAPAAPPPPH